jgi:hypothetical protein
VGASFNPFYRGVNTEGNNAQNNNIQYLAIDQITKLNTEVSIGGSIVLKSPSLDLTMPSSVDSTGVSFMYFDASSGAEPYDEENYDVVLSFSIRRRSRRIRLNSKPKRGGWHYPDDVLIDNWFQRPNPQIWVDVRQNDFEVFIDGNRFRTLQKRLGNKNITHVQYWWYPESIEPALSCAIIATTYMSTNQVPPV